MSTGMTNNPTEANDDLFRLFTRFDRNGDGLVDEDEFRKILQALGEDPTHEVLSLAFAAIDTNSDDMVEFREFKAWWLDFN